MVTLQRFQLVLEQDSLLLTKTHFFKLWELKESLMLVYLIKMVELFGSIKRILLLLINNNGMLSNFLITLKLKNTHGLVGLDQIVLEDAILSLNCL
jgi:hypothetical protein